MEDVTTLFPSLTHTEVIPWVPMIARFEENFEQFSLVKPKKEKSFISFPNKAFLIGFSECTSSHIL